MKNWYVGAHENGDKILVIAGGFSDDIRNAILNEQYDCLSIDAGDWPDLSFLHLCGRKIRKLKIKTYGVCDIQSIGKMVYLECLTLSVANFPKKQFLDFSSLSGLVEVDLLWQKIYMKNVFDLKVGKMTLHQYSAIDMMDFCNSLSLLELNLYRCGFANLIGINGLKNLSILDIQGCAKLIDISEICNISSLRSLKIADCKKAVTDDFLYDCLPRMGSLEALFLSGRGEYRDLKCFESLLSIRKIRIEGNIFDADFSAVLSLPHLESAEFSGIIDFDREKDYLVSMARDFGLDCEVRVVNIGKKVKGIGFKVVGRV